MKNITPKNLNIKHLTFNVLFFYFCPHFSWPSFMMSMQVYSQTKMLTFYKKTVYAFLSMQSFLEFHPKKLPICHIQATFGGFSKEFYINCIDFDDVCIQVVYI